MSPLLLMNSLHNLIRITALLPTPIRFAIHLIFLSFSEVIPRTCSECACHQNSVALSLLHWGLRYGGRRGGVRPVVGEHLGAGLLLLWAP